MVSSLIIAYSRRRLGNNWASAFVFFLRDTTTVSLFGRAIGLTLGCNIALALGPLARSSEAAGAVSVSGISDLYCLHQDVGLTGRVAVQLDLVLGNWLANRKSTIKGSRVRDVRSGRIATPTAAERLMRIF
ncbi:hypothetical protein BDW66DRAFT_153297 [Aspergillus desertorum]